jgi:DNA (cytosine-5)-methyltransferase 1
MASDLLLRNIPKEIESWIDIERADRRMSKRDFVIALIDSAMPEAQERLPLFPSEKPREGVDPVTVPFRFIDLFSGIGGFNTALTRIGGTCVFSSEWDSYAQQTYRAWYGHTPAGDITQVDAQDIPDHEILAAGFPCQPFSIAGVSKKNSLGRQHGFLDETQGTLFFDIARIVKVKRPPVLILENVKNLKGHDKGKTWKVIKATLEELEYVVHDRIIDAIHWVPQHRERIFIVCFDKHVFGDEPPFEYPTPPKNRIYELKDLLEPVVDPKYTLSDKLWDYLQEYARRHKAKGNGFGFGLVDLNGTTRTLSARYYKDGSEILIPQEGLNPRRLTPTEAMRLMGFPWDREIPVSDTRAYKQFGNAVVPYVVEAVALQVAKVINWQIARQTQGKLIVRPTT